VITALINHWHVLRLPISGLGIAMLAICLLIGFAHHYKANQYMVLNHTEIAYSNAQNKLVLAKQAQQDIEHYLPRYQYLSEIGFIGEERRNEWIARLHQVATQYQLLNIDYEIAPPVAYQPTLIANMGSHQMYRSVMTLKWGLLHEEDFIHLLAALREGTSPFMVRDCEISLVGDMEINNREIDRSERNNKFLPQHLAANCTIDWLTMQDPLWKENF
jgi:hypothetical protein